MEISDINECLFIICMNLNGNSHFNITHQFCAPGSFAWNGSEIQLFPLASRGIQKANLIISSSLNWAHYRNDNIPVRYISVEKEGAFCNNYINWKKVEDHKSDEFIQEEKEMPHGSILHQHFTHNT